MARFVSARNPISSRTLKRKNDGNVVVIHSGRENVKFTRVAGGWRRQRMDVTSETTSIVSSLAIANECNRSMGCKNSWARVY